MEFSHPLMEGLFATAAFLVPWELSPSAMLLTGGALSIYWRGLAVIPPDARPSLTRRVAFTAGVLLMYFVMQTRFDYLSQHMFFVHRLQHLVLHHLGPFLIALSDPLATLASGLPQRIASEIVPRFWRFPATRVCYRIFQNAFVAPVLFVGLIWFWLTSRVHFNAMLSGPLYWTMNWSMLIDGLLFWVLMLDPRPRSEGALIGFGLRIFLVLAAMVPQILIGARITLAEHDLYDVYDVCGRVWDMGALQDQRTGGVITWIPAAMMHAIAAVILIGRWARADKQRHERIRVSSSSCAREG